MAALNASQPEPTSQRCDFGEGAKAMKYLSLFIAISIVLFLQPEIDT